jgi:hypothetical protein
VRDHEPPPALQRVESAGVETRRQRRRRVVEHRAAKHPQARVDGQREDGGSRRGWIAPEQVERAFGDVGRRPHPSVAVRDEQVADRERAGGLPAAARDGFAVRVRLVVDPGDRLPRVERREALRHGRARVGVPGDRVRADLAAVRDQRVGERARLGVLQRPRAAVREERLRDAEAVAEHAARAVRRVAGIRRAEEHRAQRGRVRPVGMIGDDDRRAGARRPALDDERHRRRVGEPQRGVRVHLRPGGSRRPVERATALQPLPVHRRRRKLLATLLVHRERVRRRVVRHERHVDAVARRRVLRRDESPTAGERDARRGDEDRRAAVHAETAHEPREGEVASHDARRAGQMKPERFARHRDRRRVADGEVDRDRAPGGHDRHGGRPLPRVHVAAPPAAVAHPLEPGG